jgi:ABC-2 type transport system permease protein
MGSVLTIAKRDLMGYLGSPKAGVLYWFFLGFIGVFFFTFISMFVNIERESMMQHGQGANLPGIEQLIKGIFHNAHFILLLIIPAISMGSFAEEKRSHSFRLLQTAPITTLQIVLGKYLSLVTLMGFLVLASVVYPIYFYVYGNPDLGVIASSYLGLFLLVSAYLSFGLWVSSLAKNQMTSFLFTMLGLFMMLILDFVAGSVTGGGVAETTLKYMASTGHYEALLGGLISVADVTYFLVFIGLFLFLTCSVIDSQRWR